MKKRLLPRQQRFVDEYLIDLNATQAAIRAGYSAPTAAQIAFKLLRTAKVQSIIDQQRASLASSKLVTQERIIAEYAKLGFSDLRHFSRWGPHGVSLVSSDELNDDDAACVAEVSERSYESEQGTSRHLKIKLHDKKGALDSLARHLGMFVEPDRVPPDLHINVVVFGAPSPMAPPMRPVTPTAAPRPAPPGDGNGWHPLTLEVP